MFQQKPIWSRIALAAQLASSSAVLALKAVLPVVAYYFTSGPWRSMWVRLGYDPRTDPRAKVYQSLDARVPREKYSVLLMFYMSHCMNGNNSAFSNLCPG